MMMAATRAHVTTRHQAQLCSQDIPAGWNDMIEAMFLSSTIGCGSCVFCKIALTDISLSRGIDRDSCANAEW